MSWLIEFSVPEMIETKLGQQRDHRAGVYVALSLGMQLTRNLDHFLDRPIVYRPRQLPAETLAIVGWGLTGKGLEAAAFAERHGLPYLALEDGFLRSVALGNADPPLSVVSDGRGVYYDARQASDMERLVSTAHSAAERNRAALVMSLWRSGRLSKYNHAREIPPPFNGPFVLVVDQTAGDSSIAYGLASAESFRRMLDAALDEHPGLPIVLKVHPDVIAGRKRAHFDRLSAGQSARVTLLASNAHAPALLEPAQAIYVVTSQMGFEALMWGKPVRTFGMPFYAGWGLTRDELAPPDRRKTEQAVTLEDLVHAALVDYPRYIDPETLERCEVERLMDWMALQRRMRERFPARLQAVAFSNWKKPVAQAFFAGSSLRLVPTPEPLGGAVEQAGEPATARAVWGRPADGAAAAALADAPLLRVEDGFLRSVGLGAHWVQPLSWVVDRTGMYYDATTPSDLETMLQTACFDDALLARARALRERIVAAGITKYNVGSGGWARPPEAKRVILVPGQVEADASIAWGTPGVRRNLELVQAVRRAAPDAYLVYKPHPDVLAKTRLRGEGDQLIAAHCDEVVAGVPIHALLDAADEVQVLTSLAGFEALLRGKPVVCHGQPFYSGWGLTEDEHPHPRRTRRLTLDELVAGALILYPTYVSRTTGAFTTPERALHELQHWHTLQRPAEAPWLRLLRRLKGMRDRWRRR
jgi:capsular polysaccharide export protein